MSRIILDRFSGMVPKLDGRMLPQEAAQKAHNVNIVGGKLSPINVPAPFKVLHDPDTGKMKSMIPAGNIISIDEPNAPVITERIKMFRPAPPGPPADDGFGWTMGIGLWVSYYDQNNVHQVQGVVPSFVADTGEWEYTEDGAIWRAELTKSVITAYKGFYYKSYGLKFSCSFDADTKYFGGPEESHSFPPTPLTWSSPEWPDFSMPLTAPIDYAGYTNDGNEVYTGERYTYGHLQLVSVNASRPLSEIDLTLDHNGQPQAYDGTSISVDLLEAGTVEFYFKCNYIRNSQIFVNYISSAFDQRTAEGVANIAHSGAISRVDMKDIVYGDSDVPATGYVRLTNAAGQSEDVTYTSYGIVADVYQFAVSTTLSYSYAEDDGIVIIDYTVVGKEGPASELSKLTTVDPGELLKLSIARPPGITKMNLYRSSSDSNFRLLDEINDSTTKGIQILEDNNGIYYYYLSASTGLTAGQYYTSFVITCSSTFSAILNTIPNTGIVRITQEGGGDSQEFSYTSRSSVTDAGGGWVQVTVNFTSVAADFNFAAGSDYIDLWTTVSSQDYIDTFIENLGEELPPNGNYPHSTLAEAMEGSVVLAGHIAMIFDNDEVRPSEPYKEWVYPEEYAWPLDAPFIAAAAFGSTAVVFTDTHPITGEVGKVYSFSGQNPKYLNRMLIADDKPLLNKRSLCMTNGTAFYATTDGLMAVSPGGIQNITEGLFTRSQWLDYSPELMTAWTADNSIFVVGLATSNPIHFRFDLGEGGGLATFTTFDSFNDADMYWKSKVFDNPKIISYRNMKVDADSYPVEITLIGDGGVDKKTLLIPDRKAILLPRMRRCLDWEFEIRGRSTVSSVAVATSMQELNS